MLWGAEGLLMTFLGDGRIVGECSGRQKGFG